MAHGTSNTPGHSFVESYSLGSWVVGFGKSRGS